MYSTQLIIIHKQTPPLPAHILQETEVINFQLVAIVLYTSVKDIPNILLQVAAQ